MSKDRLTIVWTPAEFRAAVADLRALAAPERDQIAPVVDIRTRKVIG